MANIKSKQKSKRCKEIASESIQAHKDLDNAMGNCEKKLPIDKCKEKFMDKLDYVQEIAHDFKKNGCPKDQYPEQFIDDLKKK